MTTWFLHVTNLPEAEPRSGFEDEVVALLQRLLMFAEPLSQLGIFDRGTIKKIRKSRGIKQWAVDLVALATMHRAHWEQVRTMCGVNEEDLERASRLGAAMVRGRMSAGESLCDAAQGEAAGAQGVDAARSRVHPVPAARGDLHTVCGRGLRRVAA